MVKEERSREYRLVKADGVAVVLINRRRVLLLKRRSLPFLKNPGIWSFLFGARKRGERRIETAYREVREEVGLEKARLRLLDGGLEVGLYDAGKTIRWQNRFFIFRSDSSHIEKDYENAAYRWASMGEVRDHINYTNVFIDEERILKRISRYV